MGDSAKCVLAETERLSRKGNRVNRKRALSSGRARSHPPPCATDAETGPAGPLTRWTVLLLGPRAVRGAVGPVEAEAVGSSSLLWPGSAGNGSLGSREELGPSAFLPHTQNVALGGTRDPTLAVCGGRVPGKRPCPKPGGLSGKIKTQGHQVAWGGPFLTGAPYPYLCPPASVNAGISIHLSGGHCCILYRDCALPGLWEAAGS